MFTFTKLESSSPSVLTTKKKVKFHSPWPTATRTERSPRLARPLVRLVHKLNPDSSTNTMSGGWLELMARVYHSAYVARATSTSSRLRSTFAVSNFFETINWLRRQTLSARTEFNLPSSSTFIRSNMNSGCFSTMSTTTLVISSSIFRLLAPPLGRSTTPYYECLRTNRICRATFHAKESCGF